MQCFRACELDVPLLLESQWWLAFDDDDRPVGFAGLAPPALDDQLGYLCRAGVVPRVRGHGLHRRLIQVRVASARGYGLAGIVTDTLRNPGCARNLAACGFMPFRPRQPWSLRGALYWRCDLQHERL
jgi:GNAT superfamily N-acetyltransferase